MTAREGNLDAPTRHPLDWRNPDFYDEESLYKEMERIFGICHGCRRCVSLCGAFPTLFDLVDKYHTSEPFDYLEKEILAVGDAYGCIFGTGVIYNNTFKGDYVDIINATNYRDTQSFPPWGRCDGKSPYDGMASVAFEDACREAARLGIKGFDLRGPADWPTLKKYGLVPSMYPGGPGGTIPVGPSHKDTHAELIPKMHAAIDESASNGVPNIIALAGQRKGVADDDAGV